MVVVVHRGCRPLWLSLRRRRLLWSHCGRRVVVVVVRCFAESGRRAAIVSLDVVRQEGQNTRGDLPLGRCGGKEEWWEERTVGRST